MAQSAANRVALYASVGPELTHYDLDVEGAILTRRGTVSLPANVHYCWPHVSRRFLYVASSDAAPGAGGMSVATGTRSEEHTSELQSRFDLVCRLLLEK